jgi:predicted HTH domain antitoxin
LRVVRKSRMSKSEKEKAAKRYMEGKISLNNAAENAKLTIPEMVEYLVSKGYKSEYSMDDFREGITLLKGKLKAGKTDS